MAKQALGIFARETGGHFNSESLVPLEVGRYFSRRCGEVLIVLSNNTILLGYVAIIVLHEVLIIRH
jgi:hypothetical protein